MMVSILKVSGVLSWGVVLCLGLPHATLAINNLTQELQQQEADEMADNLSGAVNKEEEAQKGVTTVQGEVLRTKRGHYLVRKYTGDVVHLYLDDTTKIDGPIRQGDRIVAKVNDERHILLMHSIE